MVIVTYRCDLCKTSREEILDDVPRGWPHYCDCGAQLMVDVRVLQPEPIRDEEENPVRDVEMDDPSYGSVQNNLLAVIATELWRIRVALERRG